MIGYLHKMKGGGELPPKPKKTHVLVSWFGGSIAIGIVALITELCNQPLLMAPLGASAVLAFGVPDSPLAQPRNIIGGHLLTSLVGLLFLQFMGAGWLSIALAVATAIALMQLTRTVHPPAGANPIIVIITAAGWEFLWVPVLISTAILVGCAVLVNNISPLRRYPLYWF